MTRDFTKVELPLTGEADEHKTQGGLCVLLVSFILAQNSTCPLYLNLSNRWNHDAIALPQLCSLVLGLVSTGGVRTSLRKEAISKANPLSQPISKWNILWDQNFFTKWIHFSK